MKNFVKFTGFIALTAIITFAFTTCEDLFDNGGGGGGNGGGSDTTATYTGTTDGKTYSLKITKAVANPGGGGGGNSSLNGTWDDGEGEKLVLNNGSFTISDDNVEVMKGTYTTSGSNTITMTLTQIKGVVFGEDSISMFELSSSQWYTRSQYKSAVVNYWEGYGMSQSKAEEEFEETKDISGIYDPRPGTYTLSGSTTLSLTIFGETTTFTRQNAYQSVSYTVSTRAITPAAGDIYELTVDANISTGTVQAVTGGNLTLKPSFSGAETFNATVGNNGLTNVSGLITFDDGDTLEGPEALTPVTPPPGGGGTGDMTWIPITDRTVWEYAYGTSTRTASIRGIAYGGGKFVAVSSYGGIAYSTDGANWTAAIEPDRFVSDFNGVAYGGGGFVAVGTNGKMKYSTNGIDWSDVEDSSFGTSWNNIYNIEYGNGKFVAVGEMGRIAYSTNGTDWTAATSPFTMSNANNITDIAFGGGRFVVGTSTAVAGSEGHLAYSDNGVSWTEVNNPIDNIFCIAYGDGKFIACDDWADAAYSVDGATWIVINEDDDVPFHANDIAYGNGRFVAVGGNDVIAYSANGLKWTEIHIGIDTSYSDIVYGNGRFVATGGGSAGAVAYCIW